MNLLSRRWVLRAGASLTGLAVVPGSMTLAQTPVLEGVHTLFLQWSRLATGFAALDADVVRDCLQQVLRSGVSLASLADLDPGSYRGTELEKRLLEAWYTGVFEPPDAPPLRSMETTLMWQAAGIDPPPGSCGDGPESWTRPPSFPEDIR